jgi:hypothetical protein
MRVQIGGKGDTRSQRAAGEEGMFEIQALILTSALMKRDFFQRQESGRKDLLFSEEKRSKKDFIHLQTKTASSGRLGRTRR